ELCDPAMSYTQRHPSSSCQRIALGFVVVVFAAALWYFLCCSGCLKEPNRMVTLKLGGEVSSAKGLKEWPRLSDDKRNLIKIHVESGPLKLSLLFPSGAKFQIDCKQIILSQKDGRIYELIVQPLQPLESFETALTQLETILGRLS